MRAVAFWVAAVLALASMASFHVQAHFLSTAVPHHYFGGRHQKSTTPTGKYMGFLSDDDGMQCDKARLVNDRKRYHILRDARGGAAAAAGQVVKTMTARRMEPLK